MTSTHAQYRFRVIEAYALVAFAGAITLSHAEGRVEKAKTTEGGQRSVPICYFDELGRFCATRLGQKVPDFVSPLKTGGGTLQPSPNERFVLYYETLQDRTSDVLVLYDFQKETERLLHTLPARTSAQAEFSPNSKHIAFLVAGHQHLVSPEKEGIYVYETIGTTKKFFPYPSIAKLPQAEVTGTEAQWSADGRWLFLAFNTPNDPKRPLDREYLKLDPRTAKYEHVDGKYGGWETNYSFFENGTTATLHEKLSPKSGRFYNDLFSHDMKHKASVDNSLILQVRGFGKPAEPVEEVRWQSGDGDVLPLVIRGWINNRYLVYSLHHEGANLYDVVTKQKYMLFPEGVRTYTWLDGRKEGGVRPKQSDAYPMFLNLVPKLGW